MTKYISEEPIEHSGAINLELSRKKNYKFSYLNTVKYIGNKDKIRNDNLYPVCQRDVYRSPNFKPLSTMMISKIFKWYSNLVGISTKTKMYYVGRGIITDIDLTTYLAVMVKYDTLKPEATYYDKSNIVILAKREVYTSMAPKNDSIFNLIKKIVNDCIDNGIEVRILDKIHCFVVPDVNLSEINKPVDKELVKSILSKDIYIE